MKKYPLSQSQQGIFIECMNNPELTRYNLSFAVDLPGCVDLNRLQEAVGRVIAGHSVLHTRFVIDEEGCPWQVEDLSMEIPVDRRKMTDDEAADYIRQGFVRPFKLVGNQPLCRFEIIEAPTRSYLLYDFHHTIADGLTVFALFPCEDLVAVYEGEPMKPERKTLYAYAEEEQKLMGTAAFEEARQYYLKKFEGVEFTPLSRNTAASGRSLVVHEALPSADVNAWCAAHEVKPNILMQAAFSLLIARLSRRWQVAYTSVRHGREDKELSHSYGMFVRTVPVLANVDSEKSVADFIRETELEWKSTHRMAQYSFASFCGSLHLQPTVCFSFQGPRLNPLLQLAGADGRVTQLSRTYTDIDLTCLVYTCADAYDIRLEASDALYTAPYLRRFAKALANCIRQLMRQADKRLKDISLVDEAERQELESLGHGQEVPVVEDTLVDLFRQQAEQHPDQVAVVFKDRRLTYGELDRLTDRLARCLRERYGVKPETVVGVMIDRSEWMAVYPLAVMKAGGAYMPLDFKFPADRLAYMVADAGVDLILSDAGLVETAMPAYAGRVLTTDEALALPDEAVAPLADGPSADNSFVILYTSGSTGRPKGCVLEHHSIVNFCRWYVRKLGLTPSDRGVAYANFGFDAHMMDLYPLLSAGGTIYILPSDMRMDLTAIHQYMEDNQVTVAFFTTQIGMQMATLFDYPHLRVMSVGGEKLMPIKKPSFHFHNAYGPTECTICATSYELCRDDEDAPIGRPLDNYQLYVMDPSMHLVPRGMAGELCVAGEGVGRGYLNNPEMTAAKFVTVDGVRIYRTGDLVYWNEEGDIVYLGRMDNQVKLRGLRIEIGEIESVLARFDAIDTSAVAVQTVNGVQMLCAYYTADSDIDEARLRHFLGQQLTDFMVPEIYVRMDKLPMTPNGKVDRRALPQPRLDLGEAVAPETDAEKALWAIIAEQLKTEDFGVTTNLVSMGLTSIGAIKLAVTIQKQMSLQLKMKDMMKHPTVREWIKQAEQDSHAEEEMKSYPQQDYYPLTPNQLGIYIDWEQHRDDLQYNIPYLLKFERIDTRRLCESVEQVVAAHPYLKVHLQRHGGEVMQQRRDEAPVKIRVETLDNIPDSQFFQSCVHPFDLLDHNLYDIRIYQHGDTSWLLLNIHHIVFDGSSMNVLLNEIQQVYRGEALPAETFTAYDYALYNQHWLQSEAYDKADTYFNQLMADAEAVQYPPSGGSLQAEGVRKACVSMARGQVSDGARRLGVTESSLLMTAVMQVLHRFTREHHMMITTISNGRGALAMAHTFGMFVQTLPVVSHYACASIADTVRQMHRQMLSTIDNDKYPFTKIVEKYGVRPQLMVAYQGDVLDHGFRLGHHEGERQSLHLDTVKLPVIMNVWNREGDRIEIEIEYDSACYTEADMLTFGQAVCTLLERMVQADAGQPITSLSVVSDEEQRRLLTLGEGKHIDMDITQTFAHLFVEQARRTPDRLAVADADSQLTYGQMDAASNRLARRLIDLGICPDDLVCVMLERTKEFPLTVLALHKCGAAYVPLDFEYPNARLSYMLDNSESKLLVTTHDVLEAKQAEGDFDMARAQPFFLDDFLGQPDAAVLAAQAEPIDKSCPEGVAYMIYTSGSTGTPKGARLHQAGLRNFIAAVIDMEHLTAADRISGHRSFSFDAHIEDMYPVLTLGGSFHVMPSAIRKDLGEIRRFLFDHHITGGGYSTAVTCLLLNTYADLPIRFITGGGEKMAGVYSDHIEIINVYGPTECTDDTSYYVIKPGVHIEEIPIGISIANCWNFVVDEAGHLLPQGIAGELCFAGIQVGLGYWHREEQTARVFGDCPFVADDAWGRKVRMYHTGDLCRWNADGQIEYISRIDTQVKLRGFRIELGEIENAICRFDGIRNAVAEVKEINGIQHLCAYYSADIQIDEQRLHSFLGESLTDYMVPDAYLQMDQLPLTPNGKVNRKALPVPMTATAETASFVEPEGEKEVDIAEAFAHVLGTEKVSANDSFFALGGTSISAIKVVAALTLKGYQLAFKDVFACKTPRVLAAYLQGKEDGTTTTSSRQQTVVTGQPPVGSAYADILNANTLEALHSGQRQPMGDVLLTGATGFMGIHFLHELLQNHESRVYCVLRRKGQIDPASRLRSLLFYYFDQSYDELFGHRIFVIEGDTTDAAFFDRLDVSVNTVVNCAANVKHFSAGDDIEKVNVESVRNLISWCLRHDARLVHTSTISVAGQSVDGYPDPSIRLNEHMLDFGQTLTNQYVRSKYDAERLILDAVGQHGLNAKIMRVGTLSSRNADGEFQINFRTNGFMGRLKTYALLGCVPYDVLDAPCEFSPIDEVCHACCLLASTPREMVVFHPCNNHTQPLGDVLQTLACVGIHIEPVERAAFDRRVRELMADDSLSAALQPLLAYSENGARQVRFIGHESAYTTQVLFRYGYYWPQTSADYVERFVKAIDGFDFFKGI